MPADRRVSVRRKEVSDNGPYGRKMVRLQLSNKKIFAVHEDLICSRSPYIRKALYGNRQKVEGECPICHDDMDSALREITFCKGCGCNMHDRCMQKWKTSQATVRPRPDLTCPLCRAKWQDQPDKLDHMIPSMYTAGFPSYLEWLYKGQLPVEDKEDPAEDGENRVDWRKLMDLYGLAVWLEDIVFRKTVLRVFMEIVKYEGAYPDCTAVTYAYSLADLTSVYELKRFLVELFATGGRARWFRVQGLFDDEYPQEFLRELCRRLLQKAPGNDEWSVTEMEEKFKDDDNEERDENENEDED